jgi:dihydrofolate reductase
MAIIASLVVGRNGATSLGGISQPLSTPSDRQRFLKRHRSAAAFIIGRKSAAIESYISTQVPIFVFTRNSELLNLPHPSMVQVLVSHENLGQRTLEIKEEISGDIVIEAGVSLLTALIASGVVDELELSISPIDGDGDFVDVNAFIRNFDCSEVIANDGTRLLQCRYKGDSADS